MDVDELSAHVRRIRIDLNVWIRAQIRDSLIEELSPRWIKKK